MDREPVAIPGELSVEQALDEYFLRYRWPWFPVVDAAHQLPRPRRPRQSRRGPRDLPRHLARLRPARARRRHLPGPRRRAARLAAGQRALRRFGALMAVDADGRLSGVITVEQVGARSASRDAGSQDQGLVALDDAARSPCRPAACRRRGPSRRRGARRRRRRRRPGRRSGPGARPGGPAPSARRCGGRGTRSSRCRRGSRRAARRRRRRAWVRRRRPRSTSAKKASTEAGLLTIARSTSRHWTLPEPSQIEASGALAVEARHARLLDVAVAAEALEALDRVRGRALADPVLEDGVGEAAELGRLARRRRRPRRRRGRGASRAIVAASDSTQRSASTFCISGWSISSLAEGGAVGGVVERLRDAGAVAGGGADHAVEAGVVDHLDDRRHAAALLADHARPGAAELDLAGGVGAVAELVLEPLDVEARCARRRASSAASGSRRCRTRSGRGRGRRRTSAPSRTTCGRRARTRRRGRRRSAASPSVVLARTSEPPCFSVIAIPQRAPRLRSAGSERSS